MPGEAMSVTLVVALTGAATPMRTPSMSPDFPSTGTLAAQLCAISLGLAEQPARCPGPDGRRDHAEIAEHREAAPMVGWPKKIRRKPSASERCCIFEPGSVMAMNRRPISIGPTAA